LLLGAPDRAQAQVWDNLWLTRDQQGQRALQSGDAKAAAELFETPQWSGTAAYQGEDYDAAAKHFSEGASADDWYNRGNALAKGGKMDDAISAYKASLTLAPYQTDAIDNLKLLEQMKQQQEEQQQQNDQEEQEEQSESDESSDSEQDSESQQSGDQTPEDKSNEQDSTDEPPESAEDQQSPGEQDDSEQPPASEQPAQPEEPEEPKEPKESDAAQAQEASPGDEEEDQAMQQWLRRIPDDPSGLLREKFRYESQQRQESGETRQNEKNW
jgi:Ca-activated chloride channel family protein